ncbi:MAG: hypothetical protein EOQ33_06250 [Mesorhizobium sp.]|nr:MAG: hypothetical protein EOQ33_06250 [Mesorhizobium sp.]
MTVPNISIPQMAIIAARVAANTSRDIPQDAAEPRRCGDWAQRRITGSQLSNVQSPEIKATYACITAKVPKSFGPNERALNASAAKAHKATKPLEDTMRTTL